MRLCKVQYTKAFNDIGYVVCNPCILDVYVAERRIFRYWIEE